MLLNPPLCHKLLHLGPPLERDILYGRPLLNPSTSSPVCTTASLHLSQIASISSLLSPMAEASSLSPISSKVNLFFSSTWYDFRKGLRELKYNSDALILNYIY